MPKCERDRCKKEALEGSRWCAGHRYVGEKWSPKSDDEPAPAPAPERKPEPRSDQTLFGWLLDHIGKEGKQ